MGSSRSKDLLNRYGNKWDMIITGAISLLTGGSNTGTTAAATTPVGDNTTKTGTAATGTTAATTPATGINYTTIGSVAQPTNPGSPTLQSYESPDIAMVKPTMDTSKIGYVAPDSPFQTHNLDTGLLEFDPTASKGLDFQGREINPANIGANINQATPDYKTADNFLTNGAFVENRTANIISDPDNPLMKRAMANGMATAGTMGLHNTTMGASIGEAAVLDQAIRIGSQDATTQATGDLSRQNATYGSQRANQDASNTGSLAEQTGKINSELANQSAGNTWDSKVQQGALQGDLNKQNANIAGAQATQAADYAHDDRFDAGLLEGASTTQKANVSGELAGMESWSAQKLASDADTRNSSRLTTSDANAGTMAAFDSWQTQNNTWMSGEFSRLTSQANITSNEKNALAGYLTKINGDYEVSVQNILLDPNLTEPGAKDAAITILNKVRNSDMADLFGMYGLPYP